MLAIKNVQSDLVLEKLIYFNTYYSLVYGACLIFQTSFRCGYLKLDDKVALIMPIFTVLWCFVEFFRLRLGSFGNKCESVSCVCAPAPPLQRSARLSTHASPSLTTWQVPELSAFLVLIYLPQLPVVIWLSFVSYPDGVLPLDLASGIPQLIFLVAQASYAWRAIRTIIGKQTADFVTLCQLETATRQADVLVGGAGGAEAGEAGGAIRRRKVRPAGLGGSSRNLLGPGDSRVSDAGTGSPFQQPPSNSPGGPPLGATASLPPLPPGGTAALAASRVGLRDVAREGIAGMGRALGGGAQPQPFSQTSRKLAEELR